MRCLPALLASVSVAVSTFAQAADWSGWRGPSRNGQSTETGIADRWPEGGPPLVWTVDNLGEGFSTPSIVGGRLYVMGNRDGNEQVIALDLANQGREIWAATIGPVRHGGAGYPGPRSTPTIDDGRLYTLGINGDLVCLDVRDGGEVWRRNLVDEFGGVIPKWGYSESALIDGDRLLATPGGSNATIVALDKRNGSLIWKAAIGDDPGYSSIVKGRLAGVDQYVQFLDRGVVGVRADNGELLWRYDAPANGTANIPTPIIAGNQVFAASGYGTGGGLIDITARDDGLAADESYFTRQMKNHHGGLVLVDGALYGCDDPGILTCLDFETGKPLWRDREAGKCSILWIDGLLITRSEKGPISLVAATPEGFDLRGQFEPSDRSDAPSWPHPVVVDGRLYVRDQNHLQCYDLRANAP